jgi:hypothetical protein
MHAIRNAAALGKSIVCTIHQPRCGIFFYIALFFFFFQIDDQKTHNQSIIVIFNARNQQKNYHTTYLSSTVFGMFTHLLLLQRGGHMTYFGKVGERLGDFSHVLGYFRSIGSDCPMHDNPAGIFF